VPHLCEVYPGICLTTEEKARKHLSQGSRRMPVGKEYTEQRMHIYLKKLECWVTQSFILYGFFLRSLREVHKIIAWLSVPSVRLVFISQTTEKVEITFKTGSLRTRKVIRGMHFLSVSFQCNFLLYLNVSSFLIKQPVEQRNWTVNIKHVFNLAS
jgi:hypothetical protein